MPEKHLNAESSTATASSELFPGGYFSVERFYEAELQLILIVLQKYGWIDG